jgi:hypothetical protein
MEDSLRRALGTHPKTHAVITGKGESKAESPKTSK